MQFNVKNRIISLIKDDNMIGYNSDYIAHFEFDEEWENKVKTARFIQDGEYEDKVLDNNNSCEVPALKGGWCKVGVFTDVMTTTYVRDYLKTSIKDKSGSPKAPEPDVYSQLIGLIESGMLKGKDGYTPLKGVDYFTEAEVEDIIGQASIFAQKAEESVNIITELLATIPEDYTELSLKVDKLESELNQCTDEAILAMLADADVVQPMADENDILYADESGALYIL